MNFSQFEQHLQHHFQNMISGENHLFTVDLDKDLLWETYLESFPPGTNEIFRTRREHDCSCCRHFVKQFGNVVAIKDNQIVTLWDLPLNDTTYAPVAEAMAAFVRQAHVNNVLTTKETRYGTSFSMDTSDVNQIIKWHHFYLDLPARFQTNTHTTLDTVASEYRMTRQVFQRSLEEIAPEAIETVLDLIAENTLYRGEEWQKPLEKLQSLQREYQTIPVALRNNYLWKKSLEVGPALARIRNHSIGTLLQDLTSGMDVESALRRYEQVVAPTNYKRPKAVFTTKMIEKAQQEVQRLGLEKSLGRRFANLSDLTINNVLWANRDAVRHMGGAGGIFEALKQEVAFDPHKLERVPGMSVVTFIEEVLPTTKTLEVLLENRHEGNLVSLIAPLEEDAPSLFKWRNPFSWSYNGNLADSMKQRVKAAGGKIDGVLRFSIQWNEHGQNLNDLDAHCVEPDGNEIFFRNKTYVHPSTGVLDVDVINPIGVAVENITWSDLRRIQKGKHCLFVHCYSNRHGRDGFDAEVEFGGQVYTYTYRGKMQTGDVVEVANVYYEPASQTFQIEHLLPHNTSTRTIWNLTTNQFQPVSTVLYSPNYWDGEATGNRHYFFMVAGCQNETAHGFYNEYLHEDLMAHKHVFEALGAKMKVAPAQNQLSGLGFSSTQRNTVVVKIDGKLLKLIF